MMRPSFTLRTLFIVTTLVAVVLTYSLYRLDRKGRVIIGGNVEMDIEDSTAIGQEFKCRMAVLPNHVPSPTQLFPDETRGVAFRMMQGAKNIDRFFYKVRLSDGSSTDLGFYVYRTDDHGKPITRLSTVLLATDSYIDRRAGADKRRSAERHQLAEAYYRLQGEVRDDYLAAHRKPHPGEALRER